MDHRVKLLDFMSTKSRYGETTWHETNFVHRKILIVYEFKEMQTKWAHIGKGLGTTVPPRA